MKDIRSWLIFSLLCLLSFRAAMWLQGGTDASALTTFQNLARDMRGLFSQFSLPSRSKTSGSSTSDNHSNTLYGNHIITSDHTANDQLVCGKPVTKPRTETGSNLVYKWVDDEGQTHMSDSPPANHIASVIDMAGSKLDFTSSIKSDGVKLPLSFEGQIAAGSKRIYDTWHFFLGEDRLRQSHIKLRVIGGPERYDSFRATIAPNSKPTSGFYSPTKNEAYVKYYENRPEQAVRTSFHEISHLITASHLGPTPPWLTEGLAEYFENMTVNYQGATIYPNQAHIKRLQGGRLPRLNDFLSMNQSQWNLEMRDLNYAVAWSLMHYLMQGAPGIYAMKKVVEQAHENFCKPFSTKTALHNAYPGGLPKLESDWKKWMSKNQYSIQQT